MEGSWGFPREAQQEKGGGRGRKLLELSWNPPDWKGLARGKGRRGMGGLGPFRSGRTWPGSRDPFPSGPCLGQASPRAPAGWGAGPGQDTPGPRSPVEAPGGQLVLLVAQVQGSEFWLQWSWWHLLAWPGAAPGTPHPPSPSQGHRRLIDLSGHSTLGGWDSGWPGRPQVHARADGSWLNTRRAQIPGQPGILSQLSRWPAAAEAAAAQGCQNHAALASC